MEEAGNGQIGAIPKAQKAQTFQNMLGPNTSKTRILLRKNIDEFLLRKPNIRKK